MARGLAVLLIILSIGYVGINLVGLPPLLVLENLTLAAAYLTAAVLLWRGKKIYPLLIALLAFNAGRVSRTVWSPTGGFGELALEHIPLLFYLLSTLILTIKLQQREFS